MTRQANRLSDVTVRHAKPDPNGKKSVVMADGYGLRLVISPAGRKYWQFKTAAGGKESTAQVGIYPDMSLAAAREEASRMRNLVREGRSPVAENRIRKLKSRAQSATTFEAVANALLVGKKKNVSPAYYKKISGGLSANLYPMLGPLPIQLIDAPILYEALRKIEARGSLEMLGNVRRWAGEVFDFAKAHGNYVGDNPADALTRNVFEQHKGEHMKALAWDEVPSFMAALQAKKTQPVTVCAVLMLILTACRPGEVLGARWSEIDVGKAQWTIPATRMKMKRPHIVPLSKQLLKVLANLRVLTGDRECLFPSRPGSKGKALSSITLLNAVKRASGRDIHAHGFRALFSTKVAESLKWPDVVKEAALAHVKQGVEGAYDRATHLAARVKLMQWYADQIDASVKANT